jgi:nitrous oxidase accessory protein
MKRNLLLLILSLPLYVLSAQVYVPFHPLSLFSVITENNPSAMLLFRSFMITLLDKSEKVLPSITPDNFVDKTPLMHSLPL